MSSNLFRLSIISVFLLTSSVIYGQYSAKIELDGTRKEIKRTKKFLNEHSLSLIILDKEIDVDCVNDTFLRVNSFTDKQIAYLKTQEFVLMKFKNKKYCYYSLLTNAFSSWYYKSIRDLIIYDATKNTMFVRRKRKRYALTLTYSEKGMSISMPLSLIPCSDYRGEYDKGIPR